MKMDEHTQLINICYSLGIKGNALGEESFELMAIEQIINPPNCAPDLIFHSNKHKQTLIVEAKGGNNVKCDQLKGFLDITTEGLVKLYKLHAPEAKRCGALVTYFIFGHSKERIEKGINNCGKTHNFNPEKVGLVVVDQNNGKISTKNISPSSLKTALDKTTVTLPFPTQYYPFTCESSHLDILSEVGVALIQAFARTKSVKKDIYADVHPAWKYMDQGKKDVLAEIVNKALEAIKQFGLISIHESQINLTVGQSEFQRKLQERINHVQEYGEFWKTESAT